MVALFVPLTYQSALIGPEGDSRNSPASYCVAQANAGDMYISSRQVPNCPEGVLALRALSVRSGVFQDFRSFLVEGRILSRPLELCSKLQ